MTTKLKGLKLKNFGKFTDFEIIFKDDVTRLVGVNGAGKTTVGLTAIWAGIKGISENNKGGSLIGERFRFIGSQKATADIEVIVYDEATKQQITITNHISKTGNQITCAPVQDPEWLNNFLSVAFLSAKNFCSMTSKEQALLLGINTSTYDAEIKALKEEYTMINRELRAFGEIPAMEKVERVDVSELSKQKEEIRAKLNNAYRKNKETNEKLRNEYNQLVYKTRADVVKFNIDQDAKEEHIANIIACKNEILDICDRYDGLIDLVDISKLDAFISTMPKGEDHKFIEEEAAKIKAPVYIDPEMPDDTELRMIDIKILDASTTNEEANKYLQYLQRVEAKEAKRAELDANQCKQNEKEAERLAYIKSFKFGFEGLGVDEEGGLILHGRPVRDPHFSKGELEIIVANLHASMNPQLKVRFIDEFQSLDEDNQAKLLDTLLKEGFQVIIAEVGKEKKGDDTILLRECRQVESYQEGQQAKLF